MSTVLVTGAGGYLGTQVVASLAERGRDRVIAVDVREPAANQRRAGVDYRLADVRSPELTRLFCASRPDAVVHLASIVTPGKDSDRRREYEVDVLGSANVLEACLAAAVGKIVVTSSGAAYGYHADNPAWIDEDQPLRGNDAFAYARHKRLVEAMLERWRSEHPELRQVVLRVGTILGASVDNQITALFEKPRLLAIRGAASPFVFVWDQDVVAIILRALEPHKSGVYNVAGDGALTVAEIAARLGKRCLVLPAGLLSAALALLRALGLTRYGPEQVDFLRYRPVLANRRLKEEFGYTPQKSSAEAFEYWRSCRAQRG